MSENDETTRVIRRKVIPPLPAEDDPNKTVQPAARAKSGPPPLPGKSKTVKAAPAEPVEPATPPPLVEDDEKTRVYRHSESAGPAASEEAFSPTVGWLIVMEGPGRGNSVALGFGMNHIGRSASNRIVLDFGDEEISRKTHTTVTYDPRGKKFYAQPGSDATNLTYVGQDPDLKPVLMPTEIFGGEIIMIGRTKLKFVAFCGPNFSWD